jgi:hypothetical protein
VRVAVAFAALVTGLIASAQTKGPLEIKDPPPKRTSEPAAKSKPAPGNSGRSTTKHPEPAPPGVWREVVTDAEGRVIQARGREIAGHASIHDTPEMMPLQKAREVTGAFSTDLPDYTCEQLTWRYQTRSRPPKWKLLDRVVADVVFVQGKEHYVNVKINNKPLKKGTPFDSGTWSTGEYGTIQLDVLSHNTAAEFSLVEETRFGERTALLYKYSVEQPRSHWRVQFGGQGLRPAYEGQIWIDKENYRVLRIEMLAREIPGWYPLNVIEMTVDYGLVRVAGRDLLLPVRAENLACLKGSTTCTRNETEFRNYRKFTAASTVTTTDSTIRFEGSEPAADASKQPAKKSK